MTKAPRHLTCMSWLGTLPKHLEFDVAVKGETAASGNALLLTANEFWHLSLSHFGPISSFFYITVEKNTLTTQMWRTACTILGNKLLAGMVPFYRIERCRGTLRGGLSSPFSSTQSMLFLTDLSQSHGLQGLRF